MKTINITEPVKRVPTVSRVCSDGTLVELVYDPVKRATALAVSRFGGLWNIEEEVKVETGEVLVPYRSSNNLIANECVVLPSKPEEHYYKHELLADIRAFIHKYVDLSPLFEQIAAHYVLLSWVHDAFGELPYLRLKGDFGTGKTRALMTIGSLCYRGFFASGASTVSPIFHTLDSFGGTLILDEADFPYSDAKADFVKILNNGSMKGMPVLRTLQNRHKEFNPHAFKVFGPKIIAAREAFQDRGLESRLLTEETGTRPLRSDIPIQLPKEMKGEALRLRNRLLHYRFSEFANVKTNASAVVEGLSPRLNQTAISLLSLVDDAALRTEIEAFLKSADDEAMLARQESIEGRVLSAILAAYAAADGAPVAIGAVADRVNDAREPDRDPSMSPRWVGEVARARLHLKTRKSNGVYVLDGTDRAKLDALAYRYGIAWQFQAGSGDDLDKS